MGEMITFEIGCRKCEYLVQIGKNSFLCDQRVHLDDTEVVPIRDGIHTDDWNACGGEDYSKSKIAGTPRKTRRLGGFP